MTKSLNCYSHRDSAFLLTCHNRKSSTLNCVSTILECSRRFDKKLDIFIVDDNSTDGTTEALEQLSLLHSNIYLSVADGSQFWGGGMSLAYQRFLQSTSSYDLLLFINDDIIIKPDRLNCFIEKSKSIISTVENVAFSCASFKGQGGQLSYGGVRFTSSITTTRLYPSISSFVKCDACNFNLVSIQPEVLKKFGFIPWFTPHQRGDFYLSYLATKNNYINFIVPGFYGLCNRNPTLIDKITSRSSGPFILLSSYFSLKQYPLPHTLIYAFTMFGIKGVFIFALKMIKDLLRIFFYYR